MLVLRPTTFCGNPFESERQMRVSRVLWVVVVFSAILPAQSIKYDLNGATVSLTPHELSRRVFEAEARTLAHFAKQNPIVETYVQSLDPERNPQSVISDAYFLRRISINAEAPKKRVTESYGIGRSGKSRRLIVNSGERWPLHPEGFVEMLFPDIGNFSADGYNLQFERQEVLGDVACLRLLVTPTVVPLSGQFAGTIWVDDVGFHIVRLRGAFVRNRSSFVARYLDPLDLTANVAIDLQFDSWRREIEPGIWMPSHTYINDSRLWNEDNLRASYHYRGYNWVWGYEGRTGQAQEVNVPSLDPLVSLNEAGLIAKPATVETDLEGIVKEVAANIHPRLGEIRCRILLTTPAELFRSQDTIVISRGLLNLIPTRSILVGLLAWQVLQPSGAQPRSSNRAARRVFDPLHKSEGFWKHSEAKQEPPTIEEYDLAIKEAQRFISELGWRSKTLPALLQGGFGLSPVPNDPRWRSTQTARDEPLALTSVYAIDIGANEIVRAEAQSLENVAKRNSEPANTSFTDRR